MERNELHRKMLVGASKAAEKAFEALTSKGFQHVPQEQKEAWLTATIMHCDLCRLLVAYEECERDGLARLLWMGDIVSKLYETRNWLNGIGNPLVANLAGAICSDSNEARQKLKELSRQYPLDDVLAYKTYRHKVGHHYRQEIGLHLGTFSTSDADSFFNLITNFANYMREWVLLYKHLISKTPSAQRP